MSDTDNLIARAEAALEGVTPGPWETHFDRRTWGWVEVDGPSFKIGAPTRATDLYLHDEVQRKKDASFIAAARQLVPDLLAHLAAQAAEIARLRAERPGLWEAGRDAAGFAIADELDANPAVISAACRIIRALTPPTEGRG